MGRAKGHVATKPNREAIIERLDWVEERQEDIQDELASIKTLLTNHLTEYSGKIDELNRRGKTQAKITWLILGGFFTLALAVLIKFLVGS